MGFEVIANLYPAQGKEDALAEGLKKLAGQVKANEKGCSKYQVYRQTNAEGSPAQFVVVEEYDDKSAFDAHVAAQSFKDLGAEVEKQGLLSTSVDKPLDIKFVEKLEGFLSR